MTVKELIEKLKDADPDLPVKGYGFAPIDEVYIDDDFVLLAQDYLA